MKNNNIKILTLGSDPEFFMVDSDGNPVSSIGLIGGSKDSPLPLGDGYFIQEDNVAVEINTPPASTLSSFSSSISTAISKVKSKIPRGLSLSKESGYEFSTHELSNPKAKVIGCDPDYSPWLLESNNVECMGEQRMRSAGGHVHIGYTSDVGIDMNISIAIAKAMDLFIGVPSVLLDNYKNSHLRRMFYGKNGAFRFKEKYGMEYRTISNYWVFEKDTVEWIYRASNEAVAYLNANGTEELDNASEAILSCLNGGLKSVAKDIIKEFKIELPEKERNLVYA